MYFFTFTVGRLFLLIKSCSFRQHFLYFNHCLTMTLMKNARSFQACEQAVRGIYLKIQAVFNCVSKAFGVCFGSALLRSVIG